MLGIAVVKWLFSQNDGHLLQNQSAINNMINNHYENICLFCNKSKLGYDFKSSRCQYQIKDIVKKIIYIVKLSFSID